MIGKIPYIITDPLQFFYGNSPIAPFSKLIILCERGIFLYVQKNFCSFQERSTDIEKRTGRDLAADRPESAKSLKTVRDAFSVPAFRGEPIFILIKSRGKCKRGTGAVLENKK
ncbi:MAG: hypothetical protein CW346_04140 [Bacillaceae bacterium]|nr:hypothetical protein [Bacillaceae bacterium]